MMFDDMAAAVAAVRSRAQLDELSRNLWAAHACGRLDDDTAQRIAELINEKRKPAPDPLRRIITSAARRLTMFPPRRPRPSPDRAASRERRRRVASSGALPPQLSGRFTEGERAALSIVAAEVTAQGACELAIDAIAARAGVSRRLAQTALRLAEVLGFISIEERRCQGCRSETNVVRVVSQEWLAWLNRGSRSLARRLGCKPLRPKDTKRLTGEDQRQAEPKSYQGRQSRGAGAGLQDRIGAEEQVAEGAAAQVG